MELREGRSHCRGAPNDVVLHLAPATWAQEFGVLAAILTQVFPHLAAEEVIMYQEWQERRKSQNTLLPLKLLCTHTSRALCSSAPCTPRRLLRL